MAAFHGEAFHEPMTVFAAKGGNIDDGKRIRRLEPEKRAALHPGEALSRPQDGQRTGEALQIVDFGLDRSFFQFAILLAKRASACW